MLLVTCYLLQLQIRQKFRIDRVVRAKYLRYLHVVIEFYSGIWQLIWLSWATLRSQICAQDGQRSRDGSSGNEASKRTYGIWEAHWDGGTFLDFLPKTFIKIKIPLTPVQRNFFNEQKTLPSLLFCTLLAHDGTQSRLSSQIIQNGNNRK